MAYSESYVLGLESQCAALQGRLEETRQQLAASQKRERRLRLWAELAVGYYDTHPLGPGETPTWVAELRALLAGKETPSE